MVLPTFWRKNRKGQNHGISLLWLIVGEDAEDSSQIFNFEKMHHCTFSIMFVFS